MDSRRNPNLPAAVRPNLQPDTSLPNGYYSHPDLPDKVVRWVADSEAVHDELPKFANLLEDLERVYNIPTVHTQFVISEAREFSQIKQTDDIEVIMISDRISNGISGNEALEAAATNEQMADEFDMLFCKLLQHLGDVAKNGGNFMPDLYHYSQYMYDFDRPTGEHLVLVDTEPLFLMVEPNPKYRIAGSVPLLLIQSVKDVAENIIKFEKISHRISTAQLLLHEVVALFEHEGHEPVERLKMAIIAGVERNDESILKSLDDEYGMLDLEQFEAVQQSQMSVKAMKDQSIL